MVALWSRTYAPTLRSAFGPPKLPTTGTSRFFVSSSFNTLKFVFARQEASGRSVPVIGHHQVGERRGIAPAAAAAAARPVRIDGPYQKNW